MRSSDWASTGTPRKTRLTRSFGAASSPSMSAIRSASALCVFFGRSLAASARLSSARDATTPRRLSPRPFECSSVMPSPAVENFSQQKPGTVYFCRQMQMPCRARFRNPAVDQSQMTGKIPWQSRRRLYRQLAVCRAGKGNAFQRLRRAVSSNRSPVNSASQRSLFTFMLRLRKRNSAPGRENMPSHSALQAGSFRRPISHLVRLTSAWAHAPGFDA